MKEYLNFVSLFAMKNGSLLTIHVFEIEWIIHYCFFNREAFLEYDMVMFQSYRKFAIILKINLNFLRIRKDNVF